MGVTASEVRIIYIPDVIITSQPDIYRATQNKIEALGIDPNIIKPRTELPYTPPSQSSCDGNDILHMYESKQLIPAFK